MEKSEINKIAKTITSLAGSECNFRFNDLVSDFD